MAPSRCVARPRATIDERTPRRPNVEAGSSGSPYRRRRGRAAMDPSQLDGEQRPSCVSRLRGAEPLASSRSCFASRRSPSRATPAAPTRGRPPFYSVRPLPSRAARCPRSQSSAGTPTRRPRPGQRCCALFLCVLRGSSNQPLLLQTRLRRPRPLRRAPRYAGSQASRPLHSFSRSARGIVRLSSDRQVHRGRGATFHSRSRRRLRPLNVNTMYTFYFTTTQHLGVATKAGYPSRSPLNGYARGQGLAAPSATAVSDTSRRQRP